MFFKVLTVLCLAAVAVSGCGYGCGEVGQGYRSVNALADFPSLSAGCKGDAYLTGEYNAGYNREAYLSYPQTYAPRTIAESCKCTKTVVRPQVTQKIVNIPTVRPEVRTEVKPVVETFRYRTQPSSSSCGYPSGYEASAPVVSEAVYGQVAAENPINYVTAPSAYESLAVAQPIQFVAPAIQSYIPQAPCSSAPVSYIPEANIVQPATGLFPPRVLSDSCQCTKTVLRNKVSQRVINVPAFRQELRSVVKPVVESYSYRAQPSCAQAVAEQPIAQLSNYQSARYGGDFASIGAYSPLVSGNDYNNIVDSSALVSSNGYGYGVGSASCAC